MARIGPRGRRRQISITPADQNGQTGSGTSGQPQTSIVDLTNQANVNQFDRTFTDGAANLTIEGAFDPVAGPKQVLPRVAYVINFNMVWDPDQGIWVPKKKDRTIDDFEDGDLSEYGGDTGAFDVDGTDPVFEGSFSLKGTTNNSQIASFPGDGLDNYPVRGDVIEFSTFRGNADTGTEMIFGMETAGTNGQFYSAELTADGEIRITIDGGGTGNVLASRDVGTPVGEIFTNTIEWGDPTIRFEVRTADGAFIGAVEADDTTYDDGGIGWDTTQSTGAPDAMWDLAVLRPGQA